jgi:hypothetical protein
MSLPDELRTASRLEAEKNWLRREFLHAQLRRLVAQLDRAERQGKTDEAISCIFELRSVHDEIDHLVEVP